MKASAIDNKAEGLLKNKTENMSKDRESAVSKSVTRKPIDQAIINRKYFVAVAALGKTIITTRVVSIECDLSSI
jgi:hypothetical protein